MSMSWFAYSFRKHELIMPTFKCKLNQLSSPALFSTLQISTRLVGTENGKLPAGKRASGHSIPPQQPLLEPREQLAEGSLFFQAKHRRAVTRLLLLLLLEEDLSFQFLLWLPPVCWYFAGGIWLQAGWLVQLVQFSWLVQLKWITVRNVMREGTKNVG